MARKSELQQLRQQVRLEHRRATAKASRLRARGVEVGGTNYDPRRDLSNVKRYTKKQLETYSSQLRNFNSRQTTYYAGSEGAILPGDKVRELRQAESRLKRKADREYKKVADIALPNVRLTVAQADKKFRPTDTVSAGGQATRRPLDFQRRKLSNIPNVRALEELTRFTETKLNRNYVKSKLDDQRAQFMDMLTTIGHVESVNAARELNDYQFNILFNYNTDHLNEISMEYEYIMLRARGQEEEFQTQIHDSGTAERIANAVKWAGTLEPPKKKKP